MATVRRTNVTIRSLPCRNAGKGRLLLSHLEGTTPSGAELYRVLDAGAGKRMLNLLKTAGRAARLLLPGQTESEQAQARAWFASEAGPALVVAGDLPLPVRPDIRRLSVMNLPPSLAAAAADLEAAGQDGLAAEAEFFASLEDRDLRLAALKSGQAEELNLAVAWLENDGCARVFLAKHLHGETIGVCGNCGWCLGRRGRYLP